MKSSRSAHRGLKWPRICTALLACLVVAACGDEPADPETEIRTWIAAGVEAAEREERREIMSMISPAYADARGNNRDDIENILRVYFLRMDNVTLLTRIEDIRIVGGDVAEVDLTVGGAGAANTALGFSADAYKFSLELVRDEDWQLISAQWAEIGDKLH